jgi:hypothetical protein
MSHQPDNIFAGTQVVSLIEVRGTKNSLVLIVFIGIPSVAAPSGQRSAG